MSELNGRLSREEIAQVPHISAVDILAWLDAHKGCLRIGMHTEIRFDFECGAWRVNRLSNDGIDTLMDGKFSSMREAYAALIDFENGVALRKEWR